MLELQPRKVKPEVNPRNKPSPSASNVSAGTFGKFGTINLPRKRSKIVRELKEIKWELLKTLKVVYVGRSTVELSQ